MNPICDIDWQSLWIKRFAHRECPDDAHYWDGRAEEFSKRYQRGENSAYSEQFIEYLGLKPSETVFDMGCGNGALAVPLAMAGHPVIACDFSLKMLEALLKRSNETAVQG
ncbi:MAG: methyltransferase domain-containing protein [Coriobacteriia bacterium]|nr:methyltransferase domain-containing protein [Coriobacteriia bacterium]